MSAECDPQMKFSPKLNCSSISAYHSTAFIQHIKIHLPQVRPLAPLPAFGWVAVAGVAAPAAAACAGAARAAVSAVQGATEDHCDEV